MQQDNGCLTRSSAYKHAGTIYIAIYQLCIFPAPPSHCPLPHCRTHMPLSLRAKNLISYYEVSRCRDVSVGGGSNCGGRPYISFLFRMNFFISCIARGLTVKAVYCCLLMCLMFIVVAVATTTVPDADIVIGKLVKYSNTF